YLGVFFFSSRRRHTRFSRDWSSDVCSSDLEAERERLEAERASEEANRINAANQAAILRLMNELQTVAEGDLTHEATVTEDITGEIGRASCRERGEMAGVAGACRMKTQPRRE